MTIYLDSANLDDARRAFELGFVEGVTTNPTLIAGTGRPGPDVLHDLLEITGGPVFYQVTAETVEGRADQAREAFSMAPGRVFIKIPATTENLSMTARLVDEGVQCAVTAVSSAAQAYVAALVGAAYAIPYVNRLTRQLGDGIAVLKDIAAILEGGQTQVLAASLKSVDEVVKTILAGAHIVTLHLDLILAMGEHELSQKAIEDFATHVRT